MQFLPLSFLAGILTILAPCVLPVLPIILGGSLTGRSIRRPLIITASLGLSIIVFTLLLKASTLLIDIPDSFWTWFSGAIIWIFGLILLFPRAWEWISAKLGFGATSQKLLNRSTQKKGTLGLVFMGAALGPVFASCSPTYFLILATVLPANFGIGLLNLFAYGLGLAIVMFIVAFLGQRALARAKWFADPHGWFKRILGIIFLLVGLAIATGYFKELEAKLVEKGYGITQLEQRLLDEATADME